MSDPVEDIARLLLDMSAARQIEILEEVAVRLGVDNLIGKNNSEKLSLMRECIRLEEEAWQYGTALSEITGLCENHLARFRIRGFMRGDE